jgi:hypothetical protein
MGGVVHVPWYATGFRGDDLEAALERISAVSLRYNASYYTVYRNRDDRYKFLQSIEFEDKLDWERYWYGPEFTDFRAACQGWFQIPVIYTWNDRVCEGSAVTRSGKNGAATPAHTA